MVVVIVLVEYTAVRSLYRVCVISYVLYRFFEQVQRDEQRVHLPRILALYGELALVEVDVAYLQLADFAYAQAEVSMVPETKAELFVLYAS